MKKSTVRIFIETTTGVFLVFTLAFAGLSIFEAFLNLMIGQ